MYAFCILLSDCIKLSTYFLLKRGEASLHRISTFAESALSQAFAAIYFVDKKYVIRKIEMIA